MNFAKKILTIKKWIYQFILNPNLYIAAVFSIFIGGTSGAIIGFISGGFIGYSFQLCGASTGFLFAFDTSIILGSLIGSIIGALCSGVVITSVVLFKIHKKTKNNCNASPENIIQILSLACWMSIEIVIGMNLGATIGSLKSLGIGTGCGAVIGLIMILLIITFKSSPKRPGTIQR
ncbi:Uncharacterised protein [Legionella busanensis]|uniref:Uncharacterized protein n=1 Tax=Legionella busanensis TaxID=190655 RepID=A0A378JRW2_9GAMM|nr:hypothetical protein [Legionella busanensis]STX52600.1 Uncharacterised protein [Legionella busanensis]